MVTLDPEAAAYFNSLGWGAECLFRNEIAFARMAHVGMIEKERVDYEGWKQRTVERLSDLLTRNPPAFNNYTRESVTQILEMAQGSDWSSVDSIIALYRFHAELNEETFDQEKLFPNTTSK